MKRLLVALILAVVLTLTLATPAFAGPPEDKPGPGNMPDGPGNMPPSGRAGVSHGQDATVGNGWFWGWGSGQGRYYGPGHAKFVLGKILDGIPYGWWSVFIWEPPG
ncbi:hypothetical protein ES707_11997 [subsurface metagenome]